VITGNDLRSLTSQEPSAGTASPKEVAQALIARKKAQSGLVDFARYIDPTYESFPVHSLIAEKLEDVEAGRLRRLAVFIPPAVGKSRLCSELFPAWVMGRNPTYELIEGSYNKDKAAEFGGIARDIIQDPRYGLLFPETEISAKAAAADAWKTTLGGSYKASGVAGGIIGFHAHIAIIDDPFKNYDEAASLAHRESVWNWYSAVLLNRLRSYREGSGSVILIMQRWHDDDLGGRVEKLNEAGEEDWEVLAIPSIAEEGDPLNRAVETALLPEGPNRRPLEELYAIRARHPVLFQALHQQKPVSDEGEMFRPDWLLEYGVDELPSRLVWYGVSDWALTKGSGDFTVHIVFGVDPKGHIWITHLSRKQTDILEGVENCIERMQAEETGQRPIRWFCERVALQKAIGPVLRKRMMDEMVFTILDDVSISGMGGKDAPERAGSIAGAMQMGYIHVPANAPWLGALKHEISRFPRGRYDDQVDGLAIVGMKLQSLRGMAAEVITPLGIPIIKPAVYTFDQAMGRRRAIGAGNARRNETIMLPAEPTIDWPEMCLD